MSLTQADTVFAGLHETGANDLLTAFFTARPRHLNYRSSAAIPGPPAAASAWTTMPPIAFPGVPGGIDWGVQFEVPAVDFFKDSTGGMPPPLTLPTDRFSIRTRVTLTLMCGPRRERDPDKQGGSAPQRSSLEVWAVGHVVATYFGGGAGQITFRVDQVEIVDIAPASLETLLECLVRLLLNAALANVRLPFKAVNGGAFSLALARGPTLDDDQGKLWGNVA